MDSVLVFDVAATACCCTTTLPRGDEIIAFLPLKKLPDELLLMEWDGEGFPDGGGGKGKVSSIVVVGASSQIFSTRAKL